MRALPAFLVAWLLWPGAAHGWAVKRTSDGIPLRWGPGPIVVELALDDVPDGVDVAAARQAAKAAFAAWAATLPGPTTIEVVDVPGPAARATSKDHRNVVRWVHRDWARSYEPDALAITIVTHDPDTGRITDTDIVINAEKYQWTTAPDPGDCGGAYDLENVLAHEVGHFLGLAHEKQLREATMYPSTRACSIEKRDLAPDDVAGLRYLYEELGPAMAGCSVAGRSGALAEGPVISSVACLASSAWFRSRCHRRRRRAGTARSSSRHS